MSILYNIGIFFLGLSIKVAALFKIKAKKWIDGRKSYFKRLPEIDHSRVVYWFHCASLGEFDQGLPLINRLKESNPDLFVLVTFFSPSGMEHYQKRKHKADLVLYLPLDTPKNANQFVTYFKPAKAFFIKYEFWSNYILELKKHKSRIYNISGVFRKDHRFFKWYGGFFRKTLLCFDHFFVQNDSSRILLESIGISNITVSGDSRYDKVLDNRNNLEKDPLIATFCRNENVFIVGSSWPADEAILMPVINTMKELVIIAPHQIDEGHIKNITDNLKRPYIRYTQLTGGDHKAEVLILDTIGHLTSTYAFGSFAYVGGGFSGSLHNILEPAAFGLPVMFGPKHARFHEAEKFIENGFGFSVKTTSELITALDKIRQDLKILSEREQKFVEDHAGVTDRILTVLTSS